MNRIKGTSGVIFSSLPVLLLALMSAGMPSHVAAMPSHAVAMPQPASLMTDQMSVRELMQLDTEQALKLARERPAAQSGTPAGTTSRVVRSMLGEPRLTAIYGVGKQLMAEVVMDHVIYLYRYGQALPVGVAPGDDVYVLQTITSSCIKLKKPGASHHLCLRPTQWVGK